MADKVSKEVRRRTMQAVRSKNTCLEKAISKSLHRLGYRYRLNVKDLPGKPDIAIKKYKIVIFIDSCFWHGCTLHCRIPSDNNDYWRLKIQRNQARDVKIDYYYRTMKWNIFRIWEHDIKEDHTKVVKKITDFIEQAKKNVEKGARL